MSSRGRWAACHVSAPAESCGDDEDATMCVGGGGVARNGTPLLGMAGGGIIR